MEGPFSAVSKPIFATKPKPNFAEFFKLYKIGALLHRSRLEKFAKESIQKSGADVGAGLGAPEGAGVGAALGAPDGAGVGAAVVGAGDGAAVGAGDGAAVATSA